MRLIRLFLILLLSVSLPFANVAAAAMVHCGQMETASQPVASEHSEHSSLHAQHHAVQDQGAVDHQQQDSSSPTNASCNHCSYCQSCASAIVPPLVSQTLRIDKSVIVKTSFTDLLPRTFLEEPFRPPAFAFA